MTLRVDDAEAFVARATALCARHDLPADCRRRVRETTPATFDAPDGVDPAPDDRALVRRLWSLDAAPLGLTLAGPSYRDTPVVYANRRFRELTGYPLAALTGRNLRLLQGPETDPEAVATLREAVASWTPVTVTLRNRRRDGTAFHSRVSLAPVGPRTAR